MTNQSFTGASGPDLTGRTFRGTHATSAAVGAVDRIRLRFTNGPTPTTFHVDATAGANSMNASFEWVGNTLKAERMVSTLMGGPEPIMKQERWLSEQLTNSPVVTEEGGDLVITGAAGTLTLAEVAPTPLHGTEWVLTATITAGAIHNLPAGLEAGLLIDENQASVRLGCNSGRSTVTVTGAAESGTIEFAGVGSTRMMCAEPAMALEAHLLAVYTDTVSFDIEDDTLTLENPNGKGARFAARRSQKPDEQAPARTILA